MGNVMRMDSFEGVTNEHEVGLPPLSARRRATWDYYRIEFLPDGYPGRRTGDSLHPHPIYGPYVISDYVAAYKRTRDERFLAGAHKVAKAALARMSDLGGALVFIYEPGTVSSLPASFYSGLTQGRYLGALGTLDAATEAERYTQACRAILRSFEVPADRGGIARRTPGGGLLIEEYSHTVPDYTLNGWLTATELLHQYAETSGDSAAHDMVGQSVAGIADVLPLYDIPELANSRYRLTGPARIKLTFARSEAVIEGGSVTIPGHGVYPIALGRGGRSGTTASSTASTRTAGCVAPRSRWRCCFPAARGRRRTPSLSTSGRQRTRRYGSKSARDPIVR